MEFRKYIKVYWLFIQSSFSRAIVSRFSGFVFIIAKILRFILSFFLILLIANKVPQIAGYSAPQLIVFFLVFNLIDVVVQTLLRSVYWFRGTIVSGNFDYYLTKPLSPLFRSLFAYTDFLDFLTLFPLAGFTFYFMVKNGLVPSLPQFLLFLLLFVNGCFFALGFHIIVLGIGIMTTEIDHTIWIYRDFAQLLRVPIEIYTAPIRFFLTYLLPVIVISNLPSKALLGVISWQAVIYSLVVAGIFFFVSLKFWQYSLTKYTSASS